MVIAIDGPGGVGKSTVSRITAERLGLAYLDTGAYYRAATLAVLRAGIDPTDTAGAIGLVSRASFDFEHGRMLLDGEDVTDEIRSYPVTAAVSTVAAIEEVRTHVVRAQRAWVERRRGGAVVEGRDIGTVVFPDAEVKVFLDARPDVRAARRARDREAAGRDMNRIAADLQRRDAIDSEREVSPLRPAADASLIDTSNLTIEEVVAAVLALAGQKED